MSNPYVTRTVVEEDGTEVEKFFAYGNFCGAGHPVLFVETEGGNIEPTDLESMSSPLDDLDHLCKAHDLCYQERKYHPQDCDMTLDGLLDSAIEQSEDPACDNLMREMSSAMSSQISNRIAYQPFGQSSHMIFSRVWLQMTSESNEFPKEGTCNFGDLQFAGESGDAITNFDKSIRVLQKVKQILADPDSVDLEAPILE